MKKLIISPKLSKQCKANLSSMGFHLIETNFCPYFSPPVAFHPDMQFFSLFGKKLYSVGTTPLQDGEACSPVSLNPKENPYHNEAKLNILQVGKLLVCNTKLAASFKLPQNSSVIHVNQGYAKCSCIPVANQGVITDDPGIAYALEREELRVLLVEKGDILLPGYPYGMIGGACV